MPDQPQDIFQEVEPAADAQPVRRAVPTVPVIPSVVPTPEVRGVMPRRSRVPFLVGGAVVLLIGIVAAAVLLWRQSPPSATNTPAKGGSASGGNVNTAVNTSVAEATTNTAPAVVQPEVMANDKDRDGLTTEEEQKLGTKDSLADTDGDGLSDWDEVKVYKTNPLKPDTDGDGSTDGVEVKKGYNPNGPGKLLDFEAARQQLPK